MDYYVFNNFLNSYLILNGFYFNYQAHFLESVDYLPKINYEASSMSEIWQKYP